MTVQFARLHLMIFSIFLLIVPIGGCGKQGSQAETPTGLTISSTVAQNILTWNEVLGCDYNIFRGTASGNETLLAVTDRTSFTDTPPVSSATQYFYFITAINSGESESSASKEVSVTSPVLALGAVSTTSVSLSWTTPASAAGITSYNIYRSSASGTEGLPALASSTTTSYSDTTVVHAATYYYRVTTIGPNGESLGSNEISATP